MSTETNTSDFLKIDELRLDKEWLGQAELYYKWAEKLALARRKYDSAKANLDVTAAEVEKLIRVKFSQSDDKKPTEAAIKTKVLLDEDYKEAQDALIQASYRVNMYQAACTALEHRKRALTMLVGLHQSNYFADPKITGGRESREAGDKANDKRAAAKTQLRREIAQEEGD